MKNELSNSSREDVNLLESESSNTETFASLMKKAEEAKNSKDFETTLELYGKAKSIAQSNMTLKENLSFIISRQALCT